MGPDSRGRASGAGGGGTRTRRGQKSGQQKSDLPGEFCSAEAGVFLCSGSAEAVTKSREPTAKSCLYWRSLFLEFACRRALPLHSILSAAQSGAAFSGARVEILDLRHFTSADLRPLLEYEI